MIASMASVVINVVLVIVVPPEALQRRQQLFEPIAASASSGRGGIGLDRSTIAGR
jgi:hypothetical protein